MLSEEKMETVLISTSPEPTGHERLVVAFRDGDDLFIPLDSGRPANDELINAEQLYIREVHNQDQYGIYAVEDHAVISTSDRQRLERYAHRAISVTTEVLHVKGQHVSVGLLHNEPPGFVAVIDGSERALRAVSPAIELADWYGRPCTIVEVTGGDDDRDTDSAVALQLEGTKLDMSDVVSVAKTDLEAFLFELMRQGQVIVASAFGVWDFDGRLHGMLNGLVRHNAPAIVGIGPNVMPDWKPNDEGPIIVCADASDHAHHLVDRLDPFLVPSRARVVVAHVETEEPPDTSIATEIAHEINQRFGIPVEPKSFHEESAAAGIAILASRMESQLVITHSWHRPQPGEPVVSSTSLGSVAHAPCPVIILGDPG
jgi:nucleotide-binding universal stress UspA family protein